MAPPWPLAQGRCSSNTGCALGGGSLFLGLDAGRTKEVRLRGLGSGARGAGSSPEQEAPPLL